MSYLVANPEDRFSHDEAQIRPEFFYYLVLGRPRVGGGNINQKKMSKT